MLNQPNPLQTANTEYAKPMPVVWSLTPPELEVMFHITADKVPVVQEPVKKSLNEVYRSYYDTLDKISRLIDKHHAFVKSVVGDVDVRTATDDDPRTFAQGIVNLLFYRAAKHQSYEAPLVINQNEELKKLNHRGELENFERKAHKLRNSPERTSLIPVDLDRIQEHLDTKFGGDAGIRLYHQQQCQAIIKYFGLDKQESLTETSQGIVLSGSYYISKRTWGDESKYDFDFDRKKVITDVLLALIVFSNYMQIEGFADELHALRKEIKESDHLKLPMTWSQSRIKLKIFTKRRDWTISKEIAKKLQMYIGEFQS